MTALAPVEPEPSGPLALKIAALAVRLSRAGGMLPDPTVPFAQLGLDSLGTIELAAAIEDELGISVPPDLAADCANARALAIRLQPRTASDDADPSGVMMQDAVLPPDVRPPSSCARSGRAPAGLRDARTILVTGGSGFLGGWLAAELLLASKATLICLVRAGDANASNRVRSRLLACGADPCAVGERVCGVEGDLTVPSLGLPAATFSRLARDVDVICHVGAAVNWVQSYRGLRAANVSGTRELLRMACMHGRPFHFVSSLSVCYSTTAPAQVDETFDPLPHLSGVHLGYAQTKVVAEALVAEAARRGLPVSIYRPSLISGHSATGAFNSDDLLSLLIRGCIRMGYAPDLDWTLDALPVDIVAGNIVRLSTMRGAIHLAHPRPRHWRECVLWMRLYGYPLALVPYHAWLRRLERDLAGAASRGERHPLQPLKHLLFDRPEGARGLTIPELYEDTRRSRAICTRNARNPGTEPRCPDLDAALLDGYFEAFISAGHLPPPLARSADGPPVPALRSGDPSTMFDTAFFARALRAHTDVTVLGATARERGSAQSILSELTDWRSPHPTGLFRYTLDLEDQGSTLRQDVVLKVKARDTDAIAVGEALSGLCDERIGEAYRRWRARLGMADAHVRELALYCQTDERFTRHTPALLGSVADDRAGLWALVLERVDDAVLFDAADEPGKWDAGAIEIAVSGLSTLQSIWYGRAAELRRQPWIGWIQSTASAVEMTALWQALADHARPSFCAWGDPSLSSIHRMLVARTADWWPALESQPQTLIHNDFNPRNICLRPAPSGFRLCAYDWELATVGAPQRDLAELLCFVLTAGATDADIDRWVEHHRMSLQAEVGAAIDPCVWRTGFAAAVYDVLVSRLAMYALIHRIRRQPFLPRVVQTWRRLYERFPLVQEA